MAGLHGRRAAALLAPLGLAGCLPAGAEAARAPAATFTGIVWVDADADGIRDRGEGFARGVRVTLERRGRKGLTRVRATTSSAAGRWTLRATTAGSYRVRVILPSSSAGFSPARKGRDRNADSDVAATGASRGRSAIRVVPARGSVRIDAGLLPKPAAPAPAPPVPAPAAIAPPPTPTPPGPPPPPGFGDRVWLDIDSDGLQDPTEGGLPGAVVQLWDTTLLAPLATTVTDASGLWSIAAPKVDTSYRIRVVPPTPYARFSPRQVGSDATADSDVFASGPLTAFTDVVAAAAGSAPSTSLDIGVRRPVSGIAIGNLVWRDVDANGRQDAGEPGIAGVTVQLFDGDGINLLQAATTNGAGSYLLIAPGPGPYRIRAILPVGVTGFAPHHSLSAAEGTDSDIRTSGVFTGFSDVIDLADNLVSTSLYDVGILN